MRKILAVSGDPGGARTLQPVLKYLEGKRAVFNIVDHRFLGQEAPENWIRIPPPDNNSLEDNIRWLKGGEWAVVIFTSSIEDTLPLSIARAASQLKIPVVHLLDQWSNYTERLETDGLQRFLPDIYFVMDDLAQREAIHRGIPEEILVIAGHPGLATLASEFNKFINNPVNNALNTEVFREPQRRLVFISEPLERYAGTLYVSGDNNFHQKTVLALLCKSLQRYSENIQLAIAPHPRDDAKGLLSVWEEHKGKLKGGLLKHLKGREAIFVADGVLGMTSILILEAWLLGKPVLSVQPWDSADKIMEILKKEGIRYLLKNDDPQCVITDFLNEVELKLGMNHFRPELDFHKNAPEKVGQRLKRFLI